MNDVTRNDIRSLLKNFGIQADEAITAHLEGTQGENPLHVRLTLEDLSEYEDSPPEDELHLVVEGEIRRS